MTRFLRARVVPVTAALGLGVLLGLVGPVAGRGSDSVCVAVGIVFSSGWPWACYAFVVGSSRPSKVEAALLPAVGLAIGVVTYYLVKDVHPAIPAGAAPATSVPAGVDPGASSAGEMLVWGTAALLFGAPLGLVGHVSRVPGVAGLLLRLLVPLTAFVEATERLSVEADSQGTTFATTWNVTRVAAVLAAVALVVHTVGNARTRRNRPAAQGQEKR